MEQSWSLPSPDSSVSEQFTDDELSALAMAADPAAPLDAHAVPWHGALDSENLLPDWYMPRPIATRRGRGSRIVTILIVATLLFICVLGLCVTSGFLTLA